MDSPRCLSKSRVANSEMALSQGKKKKKEASVDQMFRMSPIPSMGKFRNDPWVEHPLMRYFGFKEKKKQDEEVVIRHGKRIKSFVADSVYKKREADKLAHGEEPVHLENFLTQDDFVEYLRDSVRSAPVIPMQKAWKKKITGVCKTSLMKTNISTLSS